MSFVGKKVYRFYTAEPAYIYGSGQIRENGEVIAEPIRWDDRTWVPIKWEYGCCCPELSLLDSFQFAEGSEA